MSVVQRAASAVLAVALVSGLSSCAAGFTSATDKVEADNASGEAGSVLARAVVLVKSKNAIPAALAGTLINSGTQNEVLERIELTEDSPGARTITLQPNLTLAPGQVLTFGVEGKEPITVPDAADLRVGTIADVVLRFRTAGEITLQVPVVVRSGFYSDIVPSAPPAFIEEEKAPEPKAAEDKSAEPKAADEASVAGKKSPRRAKGEASTEPRPKPTPTPTATEPADDEGGVNDEPSPAERPAGE